MPSHKHNLITVRWSEGSGKNLAKTKNMSAHWPKFYKQFEKPFVTPEKRKAFDKMSKEQQDDLKKINGWVSGAQFEGKWRNKRNLLPRNLVTIDIDYAPDHILELIELGLIGVNMYVGLWHSSRRHTPKSPRVRGFFPLSREVTTDEYTAIVRHLGKLIDEDMKTVDPVSYRPAQMMFRPTCSVDDAKHYFFHLQSDDSHEVIDADDMLAEIDRRYGDWRDHACLPRHPDEEKYRRRADKAEDPLEKQGPVGDLCRAYPDIEVGMEHFLEGVYTPGDTDGRYTYAGATSSNGAVIYEGKFLYSHHGTDPVCDQLVNLWDLVRIHKFGDLDTKGDDYEHMRDRPSWKAMMDFVKRDPGYRDEQVARKFSAIHERFSEEVEADESDGDGSEDGGEGESEPETDGETPSSRRDNRGSGTRHDTRSRSHERTSSANGPRDRGDDDGESSSPDGDSDGDATDDGWKSAFEGIEPEEGQPDDYDPFEDLVGSGPRQKASSSKARKARTFDKPSSRWLTRLIDYTDNGEIKPTVTNIQTILRNDKRFWGKIAFNELNQNIVLLDDIDPGIPGLPKLRCADRFNGDRWQDHMSGILHLVLEAQHSDDIAGFGMRVGISDVEMALAAVARGNNFNPVTEHLLSLEGSHDGEARAPTLFVDYFGEPDSPYVREVAMLALIASIDRAFNPGHKWDNMMIIEGPQGCRKSTFVHNLSPDPKWFGELHARLDDFGRIAEQVAGYWIIEMPELAGFTKTDANHLKSFTRKRKDDWRMAYGRHVTELPRRFSLWGTTNQSKVLKDDTGNRTYLMLKVLVPKIDTNKLTANVNQIWAEAMVAWRAAREAEPMGDLTLELKSDEAKAEALARQQTARLESHVERLVREALDWAEQPLPLKTLMEEMGIADRMDEKFEEGPGKRLVRRTCFREKDLRLHCFGLDKTTFNQQTDAAIQHVLEILPKNGWVKVGDRDHKKTRFGKQRDGGITGIWWERTDAPGGAVIRGYEFMEDDEDLI